MASNVSSLQNSTENLEFNKQKIKQDEEEERLKDFIVYANSLKGVMNDFERLRKEKIGMPNPSSIPTLPKNDAKHKLLKAGLKIDDLSVKGQHRLLSTLVQLEKMNRKPLISRTNVTALRI